MEPPSDSPRLRDEHNLILALDLGQRGFDLAPHLLPVFLSVIESCRRLAIPVRKYLADILPGLADTSVKNVTGLTPKTWAAKTHS